MSGRDRAALFAALAFALSASCGRAPAPLSEVTAFACDTLPGDPADAAWKRIPAYTAALVPQDLVEPRLLHASTASVRVQALHDATRIAFRLEWVDSTRNDLPGAARFPDGCAIQLPAAVQADVPAPQMGETGRGVEITNWKASWQAVVDGRADDIHTLYPNARVDHYPFEAASLQPGSDRQERLAAQYSPARSLGNDMAGPRTNPVQDLIAEGPGTVTRAAETRSNGKGTRLPAGWSVVITRPIPRELAPSGRSQVAFAVWDGAREEVGARKMRSVWIPLAVEARGTRMEAGSR
jgi:hypothetical protein